MDKPNNVPKSKAENPAPTGNARRDLLIGLGALVLFLAGSFGLLAIFGATREPSAAIQIGRRGLKPGIELTVMHTNDTWGYLSHCGG